MDARVGYSISLVWFAHVLSNVLLFLQAVDCLQKEDQCHYLVQR